MNAPAPRLLDSVKPLSRNDSAHRCLNCGDAMPYAPADRLLCSGCDDVAHGRVPLSIRMSSDRGRAAEIVAAGAVIRAKVEGHVAAQKSGVK